MKSKEPPYVAIPMRMFAYNTDFFVTNDEFLVFYHICTLVTARNTQFVCLNIELLNSIIQLDATNQSRGKRRIKQAILGLQSKNYIRLDHSGIQISNNELLNITTPELNDSVYKDSVRNSRSIYNGYTPVTDEMFTKCCTVSELKVLTYVTWRSHIDYAISYDEWASVLDVCHQTAVRVISDCINKGIIVKLRGDYYTTQDGLVRQETNKYFTPIEKQDNSMEKELNIAVKAMGNASKSKETRSHNWFTQKYINENDMYVYLTTTCEVLKSHAAKRIESICQSPSGKSNIEKYKEEASQRIRNEQQAKLVYQSISMNNYHYDDIAREFNFNYEEAFRKKREKEEKRDFSDILGND